MSRRTWRTGQGMLHSQQKIVYMMQCADLVDMFSHFFVDMVRRICDNISTALLQSPYRLFATGPHTFIPVSISEVQKLLAVMTIPLDTLPCSLLKECVDVFAPAITRLTNLSLQTLWTCFTVINLLSLI